MSARDPLYAEIARLRAENDELRERLRQISGAEDQTVLALRRCWGMRLGQARVLALLIRRTPVPVAPDVLHVLSSGSEDPASSQQWSVGACVYRLRKRLSELCPAAEIKNVYGEGFYLPLASKAAILAALGAAQIAEASLQSDGVQA